MTTQTILKSITTAQGDFMMAALLVLPRTQLSTEAWEYSCEIDAGLPLVSKQVSSATYVKSPLISQRVFHFGGGGIGLNPCEPLQRLPVFKHRGAFDHSAIPPNKLSSTD
ncbi:hypothetical protein O9993_06940 [Vibrio lentus]|nr:hypothetical protein [Vibrio lentus]